FRVGETGDQQRPVTDDLPRSLDVQLPCGVVAALYVHAAFPQRGYRQLRFRGERNASLLGGKQHGHREGDHRVADADDERQRQPSAPQPTPGRPEQPQSTLHCLPSKIACASLITSWAMSSSALVVACSLRSTAVAYRSAASALRRAPASSSAFATAPASRASSAATSALRSLIARCSAR